MTSSDLPVSSLVIDGVPTNIRLPEGSRATHVDSDLYGIAERIRELDPRYTLSLIEHVDGSAIWAVCEPDLSGVEHLIFRVGPGCEIDALDDRVIKRLEFLRFVPLERRYEEAAREAARQVKVRRAEQSERMYAALGAPMYSQLARLGFVDTPRSESMRPTNATARRAGRR
jgi:hypothetical protein